MSVDNIKVVIKSRPLIKREKDLKQVVNWRIDGNTIECTSALSPNTAFTFGKLIFHIYNSYEKIYRSATMFLCWNFSFVSDHIFDETSSTKDLFEKVAKPIALSSLDGINGTIFAYGQTSSGKISLAFNFFFPISWVMLYVRDKGYTNGILLVLQKHNFV